MKYICLIYEQETLLANMPENEKRALFGEYYKFTDEIKKSGHYVSGDPLQPVRTAKTLQVRNGSTHTTDGPFAETREQLGGYFLIDATDMDDALAIAARIPGARIGSIEVRPVMPT